jgi:ribosome-binding protein aMBF1 (putative translation factor)
MEDIRMAPKTALESPRIDDLPAPTKPGAPESPRPAKAKRGQPPYEIKSAADLIWIHRCRRELSRATVGQKVGVHAQVINDWECGIRPIPPERVVRLANALGLRHRDLIRRMTKDYAERLYRESGASRL